MSCYGPGPNFLIESNHSWFQNRKKKRKKIWIRSSMKKKEKKWKYFLLVNTILNHNLFSLAGNYSICILIQVRGGRKGKNFGGNLKGSAVVCRKNVSVEFVHRWAMSTPLIHYAATWLKRWKAPDIPRIRSYLWHVEFWLIARACSNDALNCILGSKNDDGVFLRPGSNE